MFLRFFGRFNNDFLVVGGFNGLLQFQFLVFSFSWSILELVGLASWLKSWPV